MRRIVKLSLALLIVCVALLYQVGCGSSSSSPAAPTPPVGGGGGGGGAVTITIVGMLGNQSFSPNPATVSAGQTVVWRNADSTTHHIVQDGGGFDTGNIPPGATSGPVTINTTSPISYHCSIHPSMVGGINGSSGNPGPGGPGY